MAGKPHRPVAMQTTAPYSLWGPGEELKKGAPLEEGETVELAGHVSCRTGWFVGRPCFLRLTDRRLTLVVHYALQSDRLITIPAGVLLEVAPAGTWIRLRYRSESGDDGITVPVPGGEGAHELDGDDSEEDAEDIGLDTQRLAEALAAWINAHQGECRGSPEPLQGPLTCQIFLDRPLETV